MLRSGSSVEQILDGLKRLEYRGYDSIGVAIIDKGVLQIRKDAGKIKEVADRLKIAEMRGRIGIGHTRWATHGAPNMINAHHHTDSAGKIALIHNGVIENFMVQFGIHGSPEVSAKWRGANIPDAPSGEHGNRQCDPGDEPFLAPEESPARDEEVEDAIQRQEVAEGEQQGQ